MAAGEWWTLAQAAIWIRTRDLARVLGHDAVPDADYIHLDRALKAKLIETRRRDGETMVSAAACRAGWPDPRELLAGGPLSLDRVLRPTKPFEGQGWFLAHPAVRVTGLGADGTRATVDPGVFLTNAHVDLAGISVATADGRLHWSAVMVALAPAESPPSPARRGASRGHDDRALLEELRTAMAADPALSVHAWVLANDRRIPGATLAGKVRRLQIKLAQSR